MTVECDVLVVGAGPAGAVTSLACVKQGLNTVLLEKNPVVGGYTKTKLDASADGELTKVIRELKLRTENEVYTSRWYAPSGNYFLLRSSTHEYFFKRGPEADSFEVSTVKEARKEGCKVFLNTKIKMLNEVKGKVDSVTVSKGGEEIHIKPKVVVAADGGNSMFHRFVNKTSENRKKLGYGVTGEGFSDTDSSNIYFDAELIPGGYFYLITGKSGVSSACIVLDSSKAENPAKEYFKRFLGANKELAEKIKLHSNTFSGEGLIFDIDRYVSKNIVFVGDAAGLLDPFFGYGMTSAIVSGYHAGRYIKKAFEEDNLALLEGYDSKIREKFDKRLSYLYQRVFESLKNEDLELIAEILNELDKKGNLEALLGQLTGETARDVEPSINVHGT
ncbi:MAG: NAD(P)/FAD-dependent oxidoreductase [Methanobacteriota archaeon]|nr:MAG: NAD(P)/FAD-dependent oxidoreductase [Euryarchaeota archaeon]